jgi:hypothetical protein
VDSFGKGQEPLVGSFGKEQETLVDSFGKVQKPLADSFDKGQEPLATSFYHCNELSGPVKRKKILEYLTDWLPIKQEP